jgi:hypothetical protein
MKKSILILVSAFLVLSFISCEKEIIEIVNQSDGNTTESATRSSPSADPGSNPIGTVTDPNEDPDFDADKRNIVIGK